MRDDNTILFDNYEPMTMSRATRNWLETHGAGPDCHEVIAEIGDWLDEGWDMLVTYQYPCPSGPIAVTLEVLPACKRKWVLDGLLPPECDLIRSHLLEVEWRNGRHPMHETCTVATLATLLHGRGIQLDPRTVLYLHGEAVIFCNQVLSSPLYNRVSFSEAVEKDGWDRVAGSLAKQQDDLMWQVHELQFGGSVPKDDYPNADKRTFCVYWRGKKCNLGNNNKFLLMARLLEARGFYISHYDIRLALYDDEMTGPTVRKNVYRLRRALMDSQCKELAKCIVVDNEMVKFDISNLSRI